MGKFRHLSSSIQRGRGMGKLRHLLSSIQGVGSEGKGMGKPRHLLLSIQISNDFSSETTEPIVTKFLM